MFVVHLRLIGETMVNQVELSKNQTLELMSSSPILSDLIHWLDELGQRATLEIIEKKLLELDIQAEVLEKLKMEMPLLFQQEQEMMVVGSQL